MAQTATELREQDLLGRYLRSLVRDQEAPRGTPAPGHDVRTCPTCGHEGRFVLDPEGVWYSCTRCGHFA
ncbi:MAG TPA: hypothetical protein VEA19_05395 [Actinomycetota bacterium]|nr:hypothetical protein [Actinomycetota bacterium]